MIDTPAVWDAPPPSKWVSIGLRFRTLLFFITLAAALLGLVWSFAFGPLWLPETVKMGLFWCATLVLVYSLIFNGITALVFCMVLLYMPLSSLHLYAPQGEVAPYFNNFFGMVDRYGLLILMSTYRLYFVVALVVVFFNVRISRFERGAIERFAVFCQGMPILVLEVFALLAMLSAFIYKPNLQLGYAYGTGMTNLLPGNAWNVLAVVFYCYLIFGRKPALVKLALVFVPLWFLLNYARVELLGLFILYAYYARLQQFNAVQRTVFAASAGLVGVLFIVIGAVRGKGWSNLSSLSVDVLNSILNYSTVQDVIYAACAAVQYVYNTGYHYTVLNTWLYAIPSFFLPYDITPGSLLVSQALKTNNGLLISGEGMLNGGVYGVFLVAAVVLAAFALTHLLFRSSTYLTVSIYIITLCSLPRLVWYGFDFYIKNLYFILPLTYAVYLTVLHWSKALRRK